MVGTFFALASFALAMQFVYDIAKLHEIRTGVFTYGLFTLMPAVGLLTMRDWGRQIGIVVSFGSAGLGILVLMSTLFANKGPVIVPSALLAIGITLTVVLVRLPQQELGKDVRQ